jgi:zinc transport system substrate-binding protein
MAASQAAFAGPVFPKVLVVVNPLVPYVDEILHGVGNAQSLLRTGQEPHTFTLSPAQARLLAEAEILITPDRSLNPVLDRLTTRNKKLRVIELRTLSGADPLPYPPGNPWIDRVKKAGHDTEDDEKPHGEHHTLGKPIKRDPVAKNDPHFWLDPERMAAIAEPLAAALAEAAPEHRTALISNAKTLSTHLRRDVMPAMRALLAAPQPHAILGEKPAIPFITYHAAYHYFLTRFDMADDGAVTLRPEDYLGAKTLDDLLMAASKQPIRCLIAEDDSPLVRRVAKAASAESTSARAARMADATRPKRSISYDASRPTS